MMFGDRVVSLLVCLILISIVPEFAPKPKFYRHIRPPPTGIGMQVWSQDAGDAMGTVS